MLPVGTASQGGPRDWEIAAEGIRSLVEQALNLTVAPARIWDRNQLAALIDATPPGAVVPGGQLTREEWLMLLALFQWIVSQISSVELPLYQDDQGQRVTMSPEAIISYRRMPAVEPASLGAAPGLLAAPVGINIGPPASHLPRSAPGPVTREQSAAASRQKRA